MWNTLPASASVACPIRGRVLCNVVGSMQSLPKKVWNIHARSYGNNYRRLSLSQKHCSSFSTYNPSPALDPSYRPLKSSTIPSNERNDNITLYSTTHTDSMNPNIELAPLVVLSSDSRRLLQRIRTLVDNMRVSLKPLLLSLADAKLLSNASDSIDELFLFVVVGEFNSGKSTFLNALLGGEHCKSGVLPTTDRVTILRDLSTRLNRTDPTSTASSLDERDETVSMYVPVPWLRHANVVDTPGTNAITQAHTVITEQFVPRADVILFVTSVDRPFSDSEREFLEKIVAWGKKVIVLLNKKEIIADKNDLQKVVEYVRTHVVKLLHTEVTVFPISSRMALTAKLQLTNPHATAEQKTNAKRLLEESGILDLEQYVFHTLSAPDKLKLKLMSPLQVVERVSTQYIQDLAMREERANLSFNRLNRAGLEVDSYQTDVKTDCEIQIERLENALRRRMETLDSVLAEHLKWTSLSSLLSTASLKVAWNQTLFNGIDDQLQHCISGMCDLLQERTQRSINSLTKTLESVLNNDIPSSRFSSSPAPSSGVDSPSQVSNEQTSEVVDQLLLNAPNLAPNSFVTLQSQIKSILGEQLSFDSSLRLEKAVKSRLTAALSSLAASVGTMGLAITERLPSVIADDAILMWSPYAFSSILTLYVLYSLPSLRSSISRAEKQRIRVAMEDSRRIFSSFLHTEAEEKARRMKEAIQIVRRHITDEKDEILSHKKAIDDLLTELGLIKQEIRAIAQDDSNSSPTSKES